MASDQVLFNEDRMRKLMKDIHDIEDHANYLRNATNGFVNQLDSQLLSQIGSDTAQVQALINKLTSKAEGMSGFLDFTIKKVKETEQANIKDAQALKQATSTGKSWWERLASSLGAEAKAVVQKIVSGLEYLAKTITHTNPLKLLIAPVPTLLVEVAKEFQVQIQTATIEKQLGSLKQDKTVAQLLDQRAKGTPDEQKWANEQLGQIKAAYTALGRSQAAYHMYAKFGNRAYMDEATKEMAAERTKLGQLGIASSFYDENVDVSSFYAGSALLACKYNPTKNDHSEMPQDNELRSLILTSLSKGKEGEWAIKRLEQLENGPQLLAYDPNQMITLEELATGKSSRYSEEQLLALRRSLSPEDQAELDNIHAKNWFHEGAVRAFLFDNLIEPYANTMDSFFKHNTAGQFINRASQVSAGETFRGKLDSTGNQTADQVASGLGKVMELFTPVAGMEVGQISFTGLGTLAKQAASKFPLIDKGVERVHGGIDKVVDKITSTADDIRQRITDNIIKSKAARETSQFGEYIKKEKDAIQLLGTEEIRYSKPSDLFKEDTFAPNGQRIAPKNLYRELIKSTVGKETLDLIEKNNIKIKLDYGETPYDEFGNRILGLANVNTNTVKIYVRGTESVNGTARTIIHEVTHNSLNNPIYTQREEIIAFLREAKHFKEHLSFSEIRAILNEVKLLYPNLPYR